MWLILDSLVNIDKEREMAQEQKMFLNISGEFAVASELNRRQCLASVTYGASKSADVFALSRDFDKVIRIEVKSTDKKKWVIGKHAIKPAGDRSGVIWVLVQFPSPHSGAPRNEVDRGMHAPRFFILTARELYEAWRQESEPYRASYRRKYNREFDETQGVQNVTLGAVERFEGLWDTIISAVDSDVAGN
jgi:hypothetical protein